MEEIVHETAQSLTQSGMEMPLNLHYAAESGDDLLLHQLLKRGSQPNEVDGSSGKTALVNKSYLFFSFILTAHN